MGMLKTIYEALAEGFERADERQIDEGRARIRARRNILIQEVEQLLAAMATLYQGGVPGFRWIPTRQKRKRSERTSQLATVTSKVLLAEYCVRLELLALAGLSDRDGRRVWLQDTATKLAQFAKTMDVLEKDLLRYEKHAMKHPPSPAKLFDQLGTWYREADRRERVLIGERH